MTGSYYNDPQVCIINNDHNDRYRQKIYFYTFLKNFKLCSKYQIWLIAENQFQSNQVWIESEFI
jgi:hypothetical protein